MSTAHRLESFASHACTRCASRKVKCDRRLPSCERCVESRSACIYVAPPPRRRRRKVLATETATAAKLRQYEDLMQAHGISVPHEAAGSSKVSPLLQNNQTAGHATSRSTTQSEPETDGASVNANSHGSTTGNAYEGNELWRGITQLRGPIDARDDGASWPLARDDQPLETDTDPLWGHPAGTGLEDDWPQPEVVMALWHTYLERFHPIYKILHAPSVDILVRNGAATCVGLSAAEKALLCAIFATAVYTVPVEDQCLTRFGGKRSELLRLYRRLARDALSVANYLLTMDLMTIQAFVIFLTSLRYDFESSPLWTLTGIAIRNAKRASLDRADEMMQSSPLQSQERRLLWFNLIYFDAYIAEVAGAREPWIEFQRPLQRPKNLNDEDINRDMAEFPPEREGATDVMFTMMRCDWIWGAQKVGLRHVSGTLGHGNAMSRQDQDQAMDEVEELFARKYVRHCDPTVPMQFWLLLTAKGMMVGMRLSTYLRRREQSPGRSALSSEDAETAFRLALKALEYEYLGQTAETLQIFRWHMSDQIPRVAVTWLVSELHTRTVGLDVDTAWTQLEATFSKHPELINHTRRPWILRLGGMVLEAWLRRETGRRQHQLEELPRPSFITELRDRRASAPGEHVLHGSSSVTEAMETSLGGYLDGFDGLGEALLNDTAFDFAGAIDWSQLSGPMTPISQHGYAKTPW